MQGVLRIISLAAGLAFVGISTTAAAQSASPTSSPDDPMEARGVGISGGIIAGAELVLLPMAIIAHKRDIKAIWPWWVFPALGAGGGGVGGYYLEKSSAKGAVALLVLSMAAVIPTAVAVASARSYNPTSDGAVEGNSGDGTFAVDLNADTSDEEAVTEVESVPESIPEDDQDVAPAETTDTPGEPPQSRKEKEKAETLAHLQSGALFHLNRTGGFGLGIPTVDVRPYAISSFDHFAPELRGVAVHLALLRFDLP